MRSARNVGPGACRSCGEAMKQTSWLSGLAQVRSPRSDARARTSDLVSSPIGKRSARRARSSNTAST